MSELRVIKKYPNRRLYDTAISQYVTLDDIRRLVTEGVRFQVIDAKTKEDITRSILLQIIVEQEESGEPILSTDFLSRVIGFYGDAMQGFMGNYLEKSMDSFLEQQEVIRKQFASMMEKTPFSVMTEMTERNLDMWRAMQESFLKAYGLSDHPPSDQQPAEGKDK
jgi:polyhydroxyalkanoate synthesis repressor PhaR